MNGRWIVAITMALAAGCGKQRTTSPPPETADEPRQVEADVPGDAPALEAAVADTTPSEAELTVLLQELTQVVRRYGVERQRVPANLEELVSAGYLARLPEAPPHKRFAIGKRLEVTLEDQ